MASSSAVFFSRYRSKWYTGSPLAAWYSFTMAKLGLVVWSATPSTWQNDLIKVVLPTPRSPWRAKTRTWGWAWMMARATTTASPGRCNGNTLAMLRRKADRSKGRGRPPALPRLQHRPGHEHLLHGNAAVLEGVAEVGDEVVVVVGVHEELVALGEDVDRAHIGAGQEHLGGVLDLQHIALLVAEVAAVLVAQVAVGVAVAHHLAGLAHAHGAVVGGDHHAAATLGDALEDVDQGAVLEPALGEAAVGGVVVGQLADHLHLRAGMAQHVHEVVDDHVQRIAHELVQA